MEVPDRGCLDSAHTAILLLVKADLYARYKEYSVTMPAPNVQAGRPLVDAGERLLYMSAWVV